MNLSSYKLISEVKSNVAYYFNSEEIPDRNLQVTYFYSSCFIQISRQRLASNSRELFISTTFFLLFSSAAYIMPMNARINPE